MKKAMCLSSVLAIVVANGLAFSAGAQCPSDPDLPKWFCELPLWLREQPSAPGALPSTNLDHLGASCAGWGDFNGDGYYDIVVGGQQKSHSMTIRAARVSSQPPISAATSLGSCLGLAAFPVHPHATS
jgi:FG-GAP repeat